MLVSITKTLSFILTFLSLKVKAIVVDLLSISLFLFFLNSSLLDLSPINFFFLSSMLHNSIKVSKALSTFSFVLHDVSLNRYFSFNANSIASFLDTSLSLSLSNLLPINTTGIFMLHLSLISLA